MFELGTDGPKVILTAVDGSDTSMRAAAYAGGLARRQNSKLVVVYVHAFSGMVASLPGGGAAISEANQDAVKQLRHEIETNAPELGIDVELIERVGTPYTEIVAVANQLRADAIVLGASAQTVHRYVGSIATQLVKAARWPVTVVP